MNMKIKHYIKTLADKTCPRLFFLASITCDRFSGNEFVGTTSHKKIDQVYERIREIV